jgi:hypothetical protein
MKSLEYPDRQLQVGQHGYFQHAIDPMPASAKVKRRIALKAT